MIPGFDDGVIKGAASEADALILMLYEAVTLTLTLTLTLRSCIGSRCVDTHAVRSSLFFGQSIIDFIFFETRQVINIL